LPGRWAAGDEVLLLDDGVVLLTCAADDDHADFAARCLAYAADYAAARHPESEAGAELGAGEVTRLSRSREALRSG